MTRLPAVPPLEAFRPHKMIEGVDVKGHELPLRGAFYRRERAGTIESIGVYSYAGRELFAAWGQVGHVACGFNAVRRDDEGWYGTRRGCPVIRPLMDAAQDGAQDDVLGDLDGRAVAGFTILTPEGPRTIRFAEIRSCGG
jgi:hypothetical protein